MTTLDSSNVDFDGSFIVFGVDTPEAGPTLSPGSSPGLGGGAIAGIVLGAVVVLAGLLYGLYRRLSSKSESEILPVFYLDPIQEQRSTGSGELSPPPPFVHNALLEIPIPLTPLYVPTINADQGLGIRDSQISHVNLEQNMPPAA